MRFAKRTSLVRGMFGLAALALSVLGLRATEGLDPMRVVYLQQAHPVLLITFDKSGSLAFPVTTNTSHENWGASGNYYYYSYAFSSTNTPSGSVDIWADRSIDTSSDSSNHNFRTGQGEWVRAASMNGKTYFDWPSGNWEVGVAGKWGWTRSTINNSGSTYYASTLGTLIDIWNAGSDNGTYVLTSTPSWDSNNHFMTFNVRKITGNTIKISGAYYLIVESVNHTFAAASTQIQMATVTASLANNPSFTHNAGQSVWYFLPPSRMTILKNALGNALSYYAPKLPTVSSATSLPGGAGTYTTGTDSSAGYDKTYYTFTDSSGTGLGFFSQAGPGFSSGSMYDCSFGRIISGGAILASGSNFGVAESADYTTTVAPRDTVGNSTSFVNWGLLTFSTTVSSGAVCSDADIQVVQQAVADDAAQGTTGDPSTPLGKIEQKLGYVVQGGSIVGLNPFGGTTTKSALYRASGTSALNSLQASYTADATGCARTYAALLVTDGESNICNGGSPADKAWATCIQTSSTCSSCSDYPPGSADTLWSTGLTKSGQTINVRTYVIGVSTDVSPCELNWTAYYGRTDAYAPDVGFNTGGDLRLPPQSFDTGGVTGTPPHNYAFFASSADAFVAGIRKILATMGAGDYTTSPPIVSQSLLASGNPFAILGSTEFSSLRGHLYAYDVGQPQNPVFQWDAGANLSDPYIDADGNPTATSTGTANPAYVATDSRKIYTWNPSTLALVEVTAANAATLDTLAGFSTATLAKTATVNGATQYPIIDFLRGKYWDSVAGAYKDRAWKLGPLLNQTAAVVGRPDVWANASTGVPAHNTFETTYQNRHSLIYVGSSDGMIHAFDLLDGYEVFALIPPNNLANQPALYYNFVNGGTATGEPTTYQNHIFGTTNSMRFADVPITTGNGSNAVTAYHTCLFVTEGPGGNDTTRNAAPASPTWPTFLSWGAWAWPTPTSARSSMTVLDLTHPYPGRSITTSSGTSTYAADPNYDTTTVANNYVPFGRIDTASTAGLAQTWSVPAAAFTGGSSPALFSLLASGFNPASTVASPVSPKTWVLNPASQSSGVLSTTTSFTLAPHGSGNIVGDQIYSNCAVFAAGVDEFFNPARVVNQGVVADLSGQIWFHNNITGSASVGIDVGAGQPIYYAPAVAYYNKDTTHQYNLYAFATGTFYEQSTAVTGPNTCSGSNFCAKLYIAAVDTVTAPTLPLTPSNTAAVYSTTLSGMQWIDVNGATHTISGRAQVVSSPTLFLPSSNIGNPFALFLVYDPGSGTCAGDSFVVKVDFQPGDPSGLAGTSITSSNVFHASAGVAGGFATTGGAVIVSISGVGQGSRATVVKVPNIEVGQSASNKTPVWWIELK